MEQAPLASLIRAHGLPSDFSHTIEDCYTPLLHQIVARKGQGTMVVGVQGSQGSGKSTLAQFLKLMAQQAYQLNVVDLSLDDFYLTFDERQTLAHTVHPLFSTRGVPGTHDVALAMNTIAALKCAQSGETVKIPRFNKAIDDRFAEAEWDTATGPIDIIVFEGWCIGCEAEPDSALGSPINELEMKEDTNGEWRGYVNDALKSEYSQLFSLIDTLAVLQAPSFECVFEWRLLQEQKLTERWQQENPNAPTRLLDSDGVKRFISHYERLTRHCLNTLPQKANWVLRLNEQHNITDMSLQK